MKTRIITTVCCILALINFSTLHAQSNVGIGTATPEASAKLDVQSTTQGFLPPRVTEAQRDAIASPAAGLIVYCTDCGTGELDYYDGTHWQTLAVLSVLPPFAGQQQGQDIDGEAAGDASGVAVSLSGDGNRLAIGAPQNGTFGHARVYEWSGTAWVQLGADIEDTAPAGLNQFGNSLALSGNGNRLIVGAYLNNNAGGNQAGHAQIFDWTGAAWVQIGNSINGQLASANCGSSVAINQDGSRIMVGTPANTGFSNAPGEVRIYHLVANTWTQVGQPIMGAASFNNFARDHGTISMNAAGSRVALGAPANSGAANQAGHVRMFELVGTTWVQMGADINGIAALDRLGTTVSMDSAGTTVAMGAPTVDFGSLSNVGAAYVYRWTGTAWQQYGNTMFGANQDDNFGTSVALSSDGKALAVGGPAYSSVFPPPTVPLVTKAYYYRISGSMWGLQYTFIEEASGDGFGTCVSISGNDKVMAVGAPSNDGNGSSSGSVRVFR